MNESEHDWFAQHVTAYVMDGLAVEERVRVEQHVAECATCAAELAAMREMDSTMNKLFANVMPGAGFEDSILARLKPRHSAVRRAAVAAAAVLVLGGFGYVGSRAMDRGQLPLWAMGTAGSSPSREQFADSPPVSPAAAESAASSQPSASRVMSDGRVLIKDGQKEIRGNLFLGTGRDNIASNNMVGKAAGGRGGFGDSHVEFNQNPFAGTQGDNVFTAGKQGATTPASPYDGNDRILLPVEGDKSLSASGKTSPAFRSNQSRRELEQERLLQSQQKDAAAQLDAARLKVTTAAQPAPTDYYRLNDSPAPVTRDRESVDKKQIALADSTVDVKDEARVLTTPAVAGAPANSPPAETTEAPTTQPSSRKIIRNGEIEFEVDSFDSALNQVTHIVAEEGGYLGTTNSTRLPNGKVSGTVSVRVPPDHLETLTLKLRALGDLKEQKISADDVSKEYTDLSSELRADRAMETRLLDLIQNGKGQIKDLLSVEKELGEWRKKIETITGQLNYFDNLVAMSTLTLTLTEKNIATPALASQVETVDMGVETEDVEKARASAIAAIDEVKGRIIDSELKQLEAGQFIGKIVADVSPTAAGGVIDRLRQLGNVARLDIQRQETTTDGHGNVLDPATISSGLRTEKKDTRLTVSLYNLANIAPRQTVLATIACDDVESAYHGLLDRIGKAGGRVISSSLTRPTPNDMSGAISFEVKSAEGDAMTQAIKGGGDVMQLNVTDNPDTNNVTTSKRGFSVQLRAISTVMPREVRTFTLATSDVPAAYERLFTALSAMKARFVVNKLDHEEQGHPNETGGYLDVEVKRADVEAMEKALSDGNDIYQQELVRSTDDQNMLDTKVQFKISLHNAVLLPPRQTWTMTVEADDVEGAQASITGAATTAGGRVVDSNLSRSTDGKQTAHLVLELPLANASSVLDHIKTSGDIRSIDSTKNQQAPDGKLTRGRFQITLSSPEAIVGKDRGLWSAVRSGLVMSVAGLLWSLQLVVIGVCFVVPWVVLAVVGWKVARRWLAVKSL